MNAPDLPQGGASCLVPQVWRSQKKSDKSAIVGSKAVDWKNRRTSLFRARKKYGTLKFLEPGEALAEACFREAKQGRFYWEFLPEFLFSRTPVVRYIVGSLAKSRRGAIPTARYPPA